MTPNDLFKTLDIPDQCKIDRRVPKKLLVENAAITARDKRHINENVVEIHWLATLKPNTIGIPKFHDEMREYSELVILQVTIKLNKNKKLNIGRLTEIVHRAVPYPLFLIFDLSQRMIVSLAHKRWAQNEADKVVLDGDVLYVTLPDDIPKSEIELAFLHALALQLQPQTNLYLLYQGWMDALLSLQFARLTGVFKISANPILSASRKQAFLDYHRLEIEITKLQTIAMKENQMAKKVELNLEIKRLHMEMNEIRDRL